MKNREYIEEMKNIKPSDELIQKTIQNIKQTNEVTKIKKSFGIKRILAGIVTLLTLSAGTVGAYVAISGNTEILQKIGINLSQNYEEVKQPIDINDKTKNVIKGKTFEAQLESVGLDNTNIVMEINLKIDEKYSNIQSPNLKVSGIEVNRESSENPIGEDLEITQKENSSIMEDGTYKIFKYLSVVDPNLSVSNFWNQMFLYDDSINCTINFSGLYDENDDLIEEISNQNCLQFELQKPDNIDDNQALNVIEEPIEYKDVKGTINTIQYSTFGNIINIEIYEENIDINKINDIQLMDFIIKDIEGNKINIISRTNHITFDETLNKMGLEIEIVVDDTENMQYDIQMIKSNTEKVSMQEVKKSYNEASKIYKNELSNNELNNESIIESNDELNERLSC